jgi:hypothetical protein
VYNLQQSACWGALPRRQRRLSRSSFSGQGAPTGLILTSIAIATALVACLGFAPFS